MSIESLRDAFDDVEGVAFKENAAGFPLVEINNAKAKATLSLYGGQLLSFQPHDEEELLFVSENAYYAEGKAVKGGVPICWPWFGSDPQNKGRAAHGFVRNRLWELRDIEALSDGDTSVVLRMTDTEATQEIWPEVFDLSLNITIGKAVTLAMTTSNRGSRPFTLTQALHTYFSVGEIESVEVQGLEGTQYIDKSTAGDDEIKLQQGAVRVESEVDRIYLDTPSALRIVDNAKSRVIQISTSGSASCVVWNPWLEIAAAMGDLRDNDYQQFVCVETTNAADDQVIVETGDSVTISATYSITH